MDSVIKLEKELKILMLEDEEEDAWLVDLELQKEKIAFTRMRVDTCDEFTDALDAFKPDVILSDHSLPQFDSLDALEICREKKIGVPFILVTGAVSEEFADACLKKGADDYVSKSNLSKLPSAIQHAILLRSYDNSEKENETLRQENIELKRQNAELDLFAYSTSHNLRAPVRSILGLINLSKYELAQNNTVALDQYLMLMEQCIGQLDDTLKHTLESSKSSAAKSKIEEINFDRLFDNIFDSLKFINGPLKITKVVNVHPGSPFYNNSMQLGVVLLNVISNSIKYYDPLKADRYVKMEVFQEPWQAKIVIEDNGIGISKALQGKVFDLFCRATKQSEGSGLGLYIVKETLERMNGRISLHSEEGIGTKVTIKIPTLLKS